MEKNHYYITTVRERNFVDAGKNKREAIRLGREYALNEKASVELWHCHNIGDEQRLGRYYIGMLEFPCFLRNCPLNIHDITVNL